MLMFCRNCGRTAGDGDVLCPYCNQPLSGSKEGLGEPDAADAPPWTAPVNTAPAAFVAPGSHAAPASVIAPGGHAAPAAVTAPASHAAPAAVTAPGGRAEAAHAAASRQKTGRGILMPALIAVSVLIVAGGVAIGVIAGMPPGDEKPAAAASSNSPASNAGTDTSAGASEPGAGASIEAQGGDRDTAPDGSANSQAAAAGTGQQAQDAGAGQQAQDAGAGKESIVSYRRASASSAMASSWHDPEYEASTGINHVYEASKVLELAPDTAWFEGVPGDGVGEWIELSLDSAQEIHAIYIKNGYWRNAVRLEENGRVKRLLISFDDGGSEELDLADPAAAGSAFNNASEGEKIVLSAPHTSRTVRLTILEAYSGSRWDDTAITSVSFEVVIR
jgi:hypothetical protein